LVGFRPRLDVIQLLGFFNINVLSWIYLNGQVGEFSDPDRAPTFILQLFVLADAISNLLNTIAAEELSVIANCVWCTFGKICLLISVVLLFDDRKALIFEYFATSILIQICFSCS
jgi:hypothetical protein